MGEKAEETLSKGQGVEEVGSLKREVEQLKASMAARITEVDALNKKLDALHAALAETARYQDEVLEHLTEITAKLARLWPSSFKEKHEELKGA